MESKEKHSVMESLWKAISEINNPPPFELYLAWVKAYFDLSSALCEKELKYADTEEEINIIYKKYMGEDSDIRKFEKALIESFKRDRKKSGKQTKAS